jgi:hypothetical protein
MVREKQIQIQWGGQEMPAGDKIVLETLYELRAASQQFNVSIEKRAF